MEELKLKKAIFYPTKIVIIGKKENTTIHVFLYFCQYINFVLIIKYKDVLRLQKFFQCEISFY
mgnify:CR=1 FL=1